MQGATVTAGSSLVIHWQKKFKPGMGYVMLSRCEKLTDIHITGDFDPTLIKCDQDALQESQRIDDEVRKREAFEQVVLQQMWTVSFINVCSLPAHLEDVKGVPILKKSHIFACGETWIHPGQSFELEGCISAFENQGRGKGLAVYSKLQNATISTHSSEKFSAAHVATSEFNVIFAYLSQGFDWQEFEHLLDHWISPSIPTALLGDVNWHWNSNHPMKRYMIEKGFTQTIKKSTHERGHILDHVYVSQQFPKDHIKCTQQSVPFSDHDVITLSFPKQ